MCDRMTIIAEHIEGHYEVHQTPHGKNYVWSPRCIKVECDGGQGSALSSSATTCRCGVDHTALIREELVAWQPLDAALHPWRDEYQGWREGGCLRSEDYEWLELCAIE
jgi:hypothetical protein